MAQFKVGDEVQLVSEFPEMRHSLRQYLISGRTATVIRQSSPGRPNRYLVKFDVSDSSHGIYWLNGSLLGQAH